MPVLSIVACEMLEDELVSVLSKDPEIKKLIVVENRDSFQFGRKLRSEGQQPLMVALDRLPSLISEIERTIIPEFKLLLSNFVAATVFDHLCFALTYEIIVSANEEISLSSSIYQKKE